MLRFALMFALLFVMTGDVFARSPYSRRERREAQKTMLRLLDKAQEDGQITRAEQFRYGFILRFRADTCCEILEAAAPSIATAEGVDPNLFGADDGTGLRSAGGLYRLDIEQIEKLFELLLKYLPQIIDLIRTIFPQEIASLCAPSSYMLCA